MKAIDMNSDEYRMDDFHMWLEDAASIQLKAVSPHGDPVELTFDEAEEIAELLLRWVAKHR